MQISRFLTLFLVLFVPLSAFSQNSETDLSDIFSQAEKLHKEYKFDSAIDKYNLVIETSADSLVRELAYQRVLQCENGITMLDFSTEPVVVTRKRVPLADFYLNFNDLGDRVWVLNPNPFASLTHPYYQSIYKPEKAGTIYYSAPNEKGVWNIFRSSMINDTLWSEPIMLSENVNSSGDDIFPILSPDGKELYFASTGHYGMGGFDLYVSRWNNDLNDWGVAENLGFPFSSTGNDILFANTPDGLYSILVSDRNTSSTTEVDIFILAYDSTPVRKMIASDEAKKIAELGLTAPSANKIPEKINDDPDDELFAEYTLIMKEIEELRSEQTSILASIETRREQYLTATNADDRRLLEKRIAEEEISSVEIRDRLEKKILEAQMMEMEFITQGITPRVNIPKREREKELQEEVIKYDYRFRNTNYARLANITVVDPIPKFDYSFRVLNKSIFAEEMPDGLIYQIQMMVTATKASASSLKGLTPIFETKTNSGKYLYTVGAFRTHAEASSHLSTVKKAGFSSAFIIAYNNGKSISINEARKLEQNPTSQTVSTQTSSARASTTSPNTGKGPFQILIEGYADGLPEPVLNAIKENTNKDVARMEINGNNVYVIAPFATQKEAETLTTILKELAVENIKLETINR